MENKGSKGLGMKNGSSWKVPKDLASRSRGLTFHKTLELSSISAQISGILLYHDPGEGDNWTLVI